MRALVVFESMFGNTEVVARAVAAGLASRLGDDMVAVVDVGQAPIEIGADTDLVVLGEPTHAFGMSRPETRRSALDQAEITATPVDTGIREWLEAARLGDTVRVATFDTRVKVRGLPGSAARRAEKRLRRRGVRVAAPAESFWVAGTPGPLVDGEAERARAWGADLASAVVGAGAR